jgi:alpha/beta superfamily hydrolase
LYAPESTSNAIVVVCHPHPQAGGDMRNNVVVAIAEAVQALGIYALTFNFRGVGRSQGDYDGGFGEQSDAVAAIEYAAAMTGIERVGLAGYSFGAGVAAEVADEAVDAVALVSPPTRRLEEASKLARYAGPVLLTAGDMDHVASLEALSAAAEKRTAPTDVVTFPGVDHFWRGAEGRLKETIDRFFSTLSSQPDKETTQP